MFRHVIFSILLVLTAGAAPVLAAPGTGKPAPDFVLKSDAGQNLRLSELRGQVVLVNFWASWCPPCRQELPLLNDLYSRYRAAGFTLLGVNVDEDRKNAVTLLTRTALRFPTLFDADKAVSRLYGVDTMPTTLLIDRGGRVRYVHRGYRSGFEKKYEEQVRELLKE